jgi:GH25 family lysozyme M1 (1,4-beta-N-acetylmuramidase)
MYMFLKWPKKGVKPPTPTQQAQAFVKAAGNAGGLGRGDLFALDVEFPGGRKETRMSPASCVEWVLEAATTLKLAYGCWPILYTSDRVYKEDLLSVDVGELVNCPLWLARYPFKLGQRFKSGPPAGRKPPVPRPWKGAYWIWQFQGNATNFPGCSGFVDMNDFNPYMGAKGDPREAWAKARLGAKTTVKAYQLSRGLKADGVAGPKTFAHLMWEPPARI